MWQKYMVSCEACEGIWHQVNTTDVWSMGGHTYLIAGHTLRLWNLAGPYF